jgi:hypothetical protein
MENPREFVIETLTAVGDKLGDIGKDLNPKESSKRGRK